MHSVLSGAPRRSVDSSLLPTPQRHCISHPRRLSRTTSNFWYLSDSPTYLSFEDVSGWYGSKTGADDLWVLPKPMPVPFTARHQPRRSRPVADGNGIRTRVSCPPRAFLNVSGSYVLLTQHRTPRDSNSAGVLIPARTFHQALTPRADGIEVKRWSGARGVSPRETPMGHSSGNWDSTGFKDPWTQDPKTDPVSNRAKSDGQSWASRSRSV